MKDLRASSRILGIDIWRDRKQSRLCFKDEKNTRRGLNCVNFFFLVDLLNQILNTRL